MIKNIIALQGNPRTGKTKTIGILYGLMKENGFSVKKDKYKKGSRDFFVLFEKEGRKIGISTYGDTPYQVGHRIEFFVKLNCEIIVCACHENGTTVQALVTPGYSIELVPKTVSDDKNDDVKNQTNNMKDANILLGKICELLLRQI